MLDSVSVVALLVTWLPWILGVAGFVLGAWLVDLISKSQRRRRKRESPNLILLAVLLIGVGVGAGLWIRHSIDETTMVPFTVYAHDWTSVPQVYSEAYIHGRLLTVRSDNLGPPYVSSLYLRLSSSLHPDTPKDVGTIAYLRCASRVVAHTISGPGPADITMTDCGVSLVDVDRNVMLSKTMYLDDRDAGSSLDKKITDYLDSLPRR
jgi:hypothetical protein